MSELTRARDDVGDVDGVAGDVKDDEGDITKGVANLNLKVDDDTPLTATIVPTGSISSADLLVHLCKAKDEIRRLEKENTDLKREIEVLCEFELQKMKEAAIGSASPTEWVGGDPMVNPYEAIEKTQTKETNELKIATCKYRSKSSLSCSADSLACLIESRFASNTSSSSMCLPKYNLLLKEVGVIKYILSSTLVFCA